MRYVLTLVVLSLSACAVPPAPDTAIEADEVTVGGTTNRTCTSVWECDLICPVSDGNGHTIWFPTNVLHRECDDGTDTVIRANPCGENCF